MSKLYKIGYKRLSDFQKDIIAECLEKRSGGMCIPMGKGKTIISLVLGLILSKDDSKKILVICKKTHIPIWTFEINKFFGEQLKYVIFHNDFIDRDDFVITDDVKLIITTPETTMKYYDKYEIDNIFTVKTTEHHGERFQFQHELLHFNIPTRPFLGKTTDEIGGRILYSTSWNFMIMDEAHKYTKISTKTARSIGAIYSRYRWCLSGTMFDEPKIEKIMGYYIFIGKKDIPDNIPALKEYIRDPNFKGINETSVVREQSKPKFDIKEYVVTVEFSKYEALIYVTMKEIIKYIGEKIKVFKEIGDKGGVKKFNAYLLAMLTYLRQCIVAPIITITNIYIEFSEYEHRNDLVTIFDEKMNKINLKEYLDDESSIESSRIRALYPILEKHKKIVVFTIFRTCLDLLAALIKEKYDREVITITGSDTLKNRKNILDRFNRLDDVIFLLTYQIGAESLNLQEGEAVVLFDHDWSKGSGSQAECRVARDGQKNEVVHIYHFVSNTGVEKAILEKQRDKTVVKNELEIGPVKSQIASIKTKEIITLLDAEINENLLVEVKSL